MERKAAEAADKKVDKGRDGGGATEGGREGGQRKIVRDTDGHDNPISVEQD